MKKKIEPKKRASSTSSGVKYSGTAFLVSQAKKTDQEKYWSKETEYELSVDHPHRQLILDTLKGLEPFAGVLEVGCNVGQNLQRIQQVYPETQMAGVDINASSIVQATSNVPQAIWQIGKATELAFEDKSFDILIYDAVLMYVKNIDKALEEARRVARKAIIILDWQTKKETLIGHSLARNYEQILSEPGKSMQVIKITKDIWPTSEKWQKYGQFYVVKI